MFNLNKQFQSNEEKQKHTVFWQDFKNKNTGKSYSMGPPNKIYLTPKIQSCALVTYSDDPKKIVMIIGQNKKLALPNTIGEFTETPLMTARRAFSTSVNFLVQKNFLLKNEKLSQEAHRDIFSTKLENVMESGNAVVGMYANPDISSLNQKWFFDGGPFLGVYGISDRENSEHIISSAYQFTIEKQYKDVHPGNGIFKVVVCDLIDILVRSLNNLTKNYQKHALFPLLIEKMNKIKQNQIKNKSIINKEMNYCDVTIQTDHMKILYIYYLQLIRKKIINPNGEYHSSFKTEAPFYNTNLLNSLLFQAAFKLQNNSTIKPKIKLI